MLETRRIVMEQLEGRMEFLYRWQVPRPEGDPVPPGSHRHLKRRRTLRFSTLAAARQFLDMKQAELDREWREYEVRRKMARKKKPTKKKKPAKKKIRKLKFDRRRRSRHI